MGCFINLVEGKVTAMVRRINDKEKSLEGWICEDKKIH